MLKSMTGFGAGVAQAGEICVRVELSSVNRKQLDVSLRLPPALIGLESTVQKEVKKVVSRGRLSGSVQIDWGEEAVGVHLDMNRATALIEQLRAAAQALGLDDSLDANALLRIPHLFQSEAPELDSAQMVQPLTAALRAALEQLDAMRAREGRELEADLARRLLALETRLEKICALAPQVLERYRTRLLAGLSACGIDHIESDERVLREIALFGDKADISEEITRLQSHLQQFRQRMNSSEPSGRPLDFLVQEFFREINTIGSKANHLEITEQVVAFKAELERIREQIQNVE